MLFTNRYKILLRYTKDDFYRKLRKATSIVKSEHSGFKLIVGGDFNATIGKEVEQSKFIGHNNDPDITSENGRRLLNFCSEKELFIMNSMFGYKDIHRWSFHSNLGYKRRLDYILCEWFVKRFSTNCRIYRNQVMVSILTIKLL